MSIAKHIDIYWAFILLFEQKLANCEFWSVRVYVKTLTCFLSSSLRDFFRTKIMIGVWHVICFTVRILPIIAYNLINNINVLPSLVWFVPMLLLYCRDFRFRNSHSIPDTILNQDHLWSKVATDVFILCIHQRLVLHEHGLKYSVAVVLNCGSIS